MTKIYNDDKLVKYVSTTISPEASKGEITAKLTEYHVSDIAWHWKPEANDIYVQFGIEEIINDVKVKVIAKVVCPVVWNRANSRAKTSQNRVEHVDLAASMRVMYWYIKSHLESAYAMQSSMFAGFLPNIVTNENKPFFERVLSRITDFAALPEPEETEKPLTVEVVKKERINVTNK